LLLPSADGSGRMAGHIRVLSVFLTVSPNQLEGSR
jgi:hypothetical protein